MKFMLILFCFCSGIAFAETDVTPKPEEPFQNSEGVVNGVHYRYYDDYSASFAGTEGNTTDFREPIGSNWDVGCEKDPITDKKTCHMHMKNLWVFVYGKGKPIISIGHDHFPGSSVVIRIDSSTPISSSAASDGNLSPALSAKVIERLKHAKQVTTRYMEWPYRSWVDDSWDMYGFNEAFQYITWAVKRVK
ncbi:MAG: hypothetical protein HY778_16400 [Betaproteobacteria bacterium]|nr:hypothetical protein [Betaproteobacteria bacterium]